MVVSNKTRPLHYKRNLFSVSRNSRFGIVDFDGNLIIEPIHECSGGGGNVGYFANGEELVVVDGAGVPKCKVKGVSTYSDFLEGFLPVETEEGVTFLNSSGRLLPRRFQEVRHFSNGLAAVESFEGKWGIVDNDGNWILKPIFEEMLDYDPITKLVPVKLSELWQLSDITGNIVAVNAVDIRPPSNGIFGAAFILTDEIEYGLIDGTGAIVVHPQYSDMAFLGDDNVSVLYKEKWVNIDFQGHCIFQSDADGLGSVIDGLARAYFGGNRTSTGLTGGKFRFLDRSGNTAFPFEFDFALDFADGVCEIGILKVGSTEDYSSGLINKNGLIVWRP